MTVDMLEKLREKLEIMKKLIAGVILLSMLSSCNNKKSKIDPFCIYYSRSGFNPSSD